MTIKPEFKCYAVKKLTLDNWVSEIDEAIKCYRNKAPQLGYELLRNIQLRIKYLMKKQDGGEYDEN